MTAFLAIVHKNRVSDCTKSEKLQPKNKIHTIVTKKKIFYAKI